jgi:hypothetical protein
MIRIAKPAPPATLSGKGVKKALADKQAFDEEPNRFETGKKKFDFKSDIYAARSVKNALIASHHGKCFACESKVVAVDHGDVEHFRPKGGYQQSSTDPISQLGYYWLAYDWENLLLCCGVCNQKHKRNLFPLANPLARARNHTDDVAAERPLLIDPQKIDPRAHIEFVSEVARARNNSELGKTTICTMGLYRKNLEDLRLEKIAPIKLAAKTVLKGFGTKKYREEVLTELQNLRQPDKSYSAMVDDYLLSVGL